MNDRPCIKYKAFIARGGLEKSMMTYSVSTGNTTVILCGSPVITIITRKIGQYGIFGILGIQLSQGFIQFHTNTVNESHLSSCGKIPSQGV